MGDRVGELRHKHTEATFRRETLQSRRFAIIWYRKTAMSDVQTRFDQALESLMSKVQADRCVLAAVLLGSLSHDTVWRKSDIDILLVLEEAKVKKEGLSLVEMGVNIHAMMTTRS